MTMWRSAVASPTAPTAPKAGGTAGEGRGSALRNARHETFACLIVAGRSASDAYRIAYPGSRRWLASSVHARACKLARNAKVVPRIAELCAAAASEAVATRKEMAEYLTRVVRTPVSALDATSDLVQEWTERGNSKTVRMVSKIDAVDRLCRLMGYYEPDRSEQAHRFVADSDVLEALGC